MLALAFAITLFAQGNPIAPVPSEVHVTSTTVLQVPPMDPQATAEMATVADQSFIINVVQPIPVQFANEMCSLPDIWRQTPPEWTYQQSAIRTLAIGSSVAGAAFLGLAIFTNGLSTALGQGMSFGRVIFAAITCAGNLIWWQIGITINNAITSSIGAPDFCGSLIRPHMQPVMTMPDVGQSIAAPVLVIVYAVVSILVLVSMFFRLGMIDVLIALGGLAMIGWADEHTEWIAQWYARFSAGTLFGQVLFVVGLEVARALSGLGTGAAGSLLGICVLLLCRRLPGLLASQGATNGGAHGGLVLMMLARRLITRII